METTPQLGFVETHREFCKRALLCPPPVLFMIEFLPISNKGSHNHGMRIFPHNNGKSGSASTQSSDFEYEIWRKWEDILWFQQDLETIYRRAAREKKLKLAQGKGVKGLNGFYKQDMASSFESLPAGPLPSSVAQDIHQYLPRVSKKGTIFRASQKTLDRRQKEFRALIEALFSDDVPSLISELRATHSVTDFFGLWRRDYDLMENSPSATRNFVTSNIHSLYFADRKRPSRERPQSIGSIRSGFTILTCSIQSFEDMPQYSPSISSESSHRLSSSSDDGSILSSGIRPRALSNTSSDASSTCSDEPYTDVVSVPAIVGESPLTFHHNPILSVDRPSVLEVLPEERELIAELPESYFEPQKCQADNLLGDLKADPEASTWQKVGSLASSDEALDSLRESTHSIDSSLADSADAVVPLAPPNCPLPVPISQFDTDSDSLDEMSISIASEAASPTMASDDCSETPTQESPDPRPTTPTMANSKSCYLGSSFELASPSTTLPITGASLSIKAVHDLTIIMLRVRRDAPFEDVRQRLYEKFSRQERVRLPKDFSLAIVDSPTTLPGQTESQPGVLSASSAEKLDLRFIKTQDDWEQVVLVRDSNKVTLKVLDTQTS